MIWSAFLLGFLGGLHCLGMCGPIAISLPKGESGIPEIINKSVYNFGRILTYTFMGLAVGTIGMGFSFAGWQQSLSIIAGISLITISIMSGFRQFEVSGLAFLVKFAGFLRTIFSNFLQKQTSGGMLVVGILNGFLPCGLVYVALAGALAGGGILESATYMAVFGFGTFPAMLGISFGFTLIAPAVRRRLFKIIPVLVLVLGLLFVLRGLNLGIPYVSPKLDNQESHMHH